MQRLEQICDVVEITENIEAAREANLGPTRRFRVRRGTRHIAVGTTFLSNPIRESFSTREIKPWLEFQPSWTISTKLNGGTDLQRFRVRP